MLRCTLRIYRHFKMFAPADTTDSPYSGQTSKSVLAKFDGFAADIQKLREALYIIHSCNSTSVADDDILSTVTAKHLGKRDGISCDTRSFAHLQWKIHSAFKALQTHTKFSDGGSVANTVFSTSFITG